MITVEKIDLLEKLIGKVRGAYGEFSTLSKKTPNDGVNPFKLKIANSILKECNEFLGAAYLPLSDFNEFDSDDAPTNSDVAFVYSQYDEALEKFRSDNVINDNPFWRYNIKEAVIITTAPRKVKKGKYE